MIWVLFLFLSFPFFSYLCFKFIPSGSVFLFFISFIVYLFLSFGFYWKSFKFSLTLKNSSLSIANSILVVHSFFVILFLSLVLYHDYHRWEIEPNGMLDGIVLWNVKAKFIGESFLHSKPVLFHNLYWKFDSYPLGLPLTLAFFTVLKGGWSLNISYFYAIFLSLLCIGLFLSFLSQYSISLKQLILSWIVFYAFMLEFNTLMNHSSIVADFPIFVGVFCLAYLYFSKWTSWTTFLFALNLSWLLFNKNEGIFYVFFGILLYFLKLSTSHGLNKKNEFFKFSLFFILTIIPSIVHKLESEITPPGFQRKQEIIWSGRLLLEKAKWIVSYGLKFHFQFLLGIPWVIWLIYLVFEKGSIEKYFFLGVLFLIPLLYMIIYFFSNYGYHLKEHLESSFHRINTHYLPLFLFSFLHTLKNYFQFNKE